MLYRISPVDANSFVTFACLLSLLVWICILSALHRKGNEYFLLERDSWPYFPCDDQFYSTITSCISLICINLYVYEIEEREQKAGLGQTHGEAYSWHNFHYFLDFIISFLLHAEYRIRNNLYLKYILSNWFNS